MSVQGGSIPEIGREASEPVHLERKPPKREKEVWDRINKEFSELDKEKWTDFSRGHSTPEEYVENMNVMLADFLKNKAEFQRHTKEFFKHNPINDEPLEEMRMLKRKLNKEAKKPNAPVEIKEQAKESIRAYSHMLKIHKEKKKYSIAREEDKCYKKNFWKTARDVVN